MKFKVLGALAISSVLLTALANPAVSIGDKTDISDVSNDVVASHFDKRGEWEDAYHHAYTWTGPMAASQATEIDQKYNWYSHPLQEQKDAEATSATSTNQAKRGEWEDAYNYAYTWIRTTAPQSQATETGQEYDIYGRPIPESVDIYMMPISARAVPVYTGTVMTSEGLEDAAEADSDRHWGADHGEELYGEDELESKFGGFDQFVTTGRLDGNGNENENNGPASGADTGSWEKRDAPPVALREYARKNWQGAGLVHNLDGKCTNRFYGALGSMNPEPGVTCTMYAETNCARGPRPPSWAMLVHDDEAGKDFMTSYWDSRGFLVDVAGGQGGPGSFLCQKAT